MAKRLTDSLKWDDEWFLDLLPEHKLAWIYLLDKCDHAGVFKSNLKLMNFCLGSNYTVAELLSIFNSRIKVLDNGYWFIKKFVLFQQKVSSLEELNPKNNCHKSIINILSNNGVLSPLVAPSEGLARGYSNSKGKGKGKGKALKDMEKRTLFSKPTLEQVSQYCKERKNSIDPSKWIDHYEANGWMVGKNKMKDWKASIRTWEHNDRPTATGWGQTGEGKL